MKYSASFEEVILAVNCLVGSIPKIGQNFRYKYAIP
jgi:hypothetical protein